MIDTLLENTGNLGHFCKTRNYNLCSMVEQLYIFSQMPICLDEDEEASLGFKVQNYNFSNNYTFGAAV